jgi:hypothetical protein
MKDGLRGLLLKIFGTAEAVAVLALAWLKPEAVPETILLALALWLVVFNLARREKRALPVKVDIK